MQQNGAQMLPRGPGGVGMPNIMPPRSKQKQKPRYWNEEEDKLLKAAIKKHGTDGYHTWKEVATHVPKRSYRECMQRWTKVLAPGLKKGKWSPEEDALLRKLVGEQQKGLGGANGKRIVWMKVAEEFKGRSCKQCRERWINHLDPEVNKSEWQQEEDIKLLQLFERSPNKWAKIARELKGRTENMVKVRWNALNRQAKKRKQNSLYYPGANPYIPNPQNYNQFYINNSFSLNLRQPSSSSALKGEDKQREVRKNSLYLFPNADWSNTMNVPHFPTIQGLGQYTQQQQMESELTQSKGEQLRKSSLALASLQSQKEEEKKGNTVVAQRKGALNLDSGGVRRLSFSMNGYFEDPQTELQPHSRRLSSFLYNDLVKNMSSGHLLPANSVPVPSLGDMSQLPKRQRTDEENTEQQK